MNRVSRRHVPSNNPNYIRKPGSSYPADVYDLLPMLGVTGGRLPDEGVPPKVVQGITVWVTPKKGKPSFIRTMARCPQCSRVLTASRLQQHKCEVLS